MRKISDRVTKFALLTLAGAFTMMASADPAAEEAKLRDRKIVKNIVNAISMYQLEYGRLPSLHGAGGDASKKSEGALLQILLGSNADELNPREKVFLQAEVTVNPKTQKRQILDSHGRPFTIVMDTDYDETINDPRTKKPLRKTVIVYSTGEKLDDPKDDILSWK